MAVVVYAVVFVAVIAGGGARLAFFPPAAQYVRVAGITPSMSVLRAANRVLGAEILGASKPVRREDLDGIDPTKMRAAYHLVHEELFANTRQAARAGAKIVVWSENAAVLRAEDRPALLAEAAALARQEHIYLNIAENVLFLSDRTQLIDPTGSVLWTYDKAHPISGMETYVPGNARVPVVQTPWGRLANVICYDADFPAMMRVDADIMLVPGGDWPQIGRVHTLKMASLRAIENGYSLFRVDYNGLSAAFDNQGRVVSTQDTTTSDQHVMIVDLPARGAATIYRVIGDAFAWLCAAGAGCFIVLGFSRRRAARDAS